MHTVPAAPPASLFLGGSNSSPPTMSQDLTPILRCPGLEAGVPGGLTAGYLAARPGGGETNNDTSLAGFSRF